MPMAYPMSLSTSRRMMKRRSM